MYVCGVGGVCVGGGGGVCVFVHVFVRVCVQNEVLQMNFLGPNIFHPRICSGILCFFCVFFL